MAEELTLIGDDAQIGKIDWGVEKIGDATKTLDEHAGGTVGSGRGKGDWMITAKAASGSIWGDLVIGDIFPADGDEVPIVGDKAQYGTFTELGDCSGWEATISAKEADITLLKHKFMQYRSGKADFDGKMTGIFTIGVTDQPGGLLNRFFTIVKKTAAGVITITQKTDQPLWIKAFVRETSVPGMNAEFLLAKVNLFGIKLGAAIGQGQAFDSKMRLAGIDPKFYVLENAA